MPAPSDLVHETSTTTGTGNFTLANVNGKRSFNTAFGTGGTDVFDYFISNQSAAEWERGTGHLSAASTLVRDTVIASSNANAAVNFAAGTKDVTNDVPAAKQFYLTATALTQANLAIEDRLPVDDVSAAAAKEALLGSIFGFFRGFIDGLILSNGADATNDIDIAAGCAVAADQSCLLVLASSLTKQLDAAWAVGTNQGGLDTGSIANTTYFLWLIRRSDTGVVDALFSASASSPTMPTNYDQKRRIGSIIRSGGAIVGFVQNGNYFRRKSPAADYSSTNPGTSAVTVTLSVPVGIKVLSHLKVQISATGAASQIYVSDLSATDEVVGAAHQMSGGNSAQDGRVMAEVYTNTSGQVRSRVSSSDASTIASIATYGWWDFRGRDA